MDFVTVDLDTFKECIKNDELELFKLLKIGNEDEEYITLNLRIKEQYEQNRDAILKALVSLEGDMYEFIFDDNDDLSFTNEGKLIVKLKKEKIFLPVTNQFYNAKGIKSYINSDVYFSYKDVFQLDDSLSKTDAKLIVYIENDIYQGCTWIMESEKYIGMYGIRSSVINVLNKKRGIAQKILNYVKSISFGRTIVIPWPLESMRNLLFKNGFIEHNTREKTEERIFLGPYAGTSNYFTY